MERVDQAGKHTSKDQLNTPKLNQLEEIHKMTILEENETMRGSIDKTKSA